ncbi:hypothetical protein K443DRAFT_429739 [Laccaria amethystina LaAM-08-1]|uniref:Uncharacterized protein n=1 Tax=Laccaria amethystina LaAM-08-1 TaxID=1095629 RepID=A0A0C9WV89_9AGAR|nr:hypothetical protein K443DRAFT_429739 [Laccaria amethystina LaAM-08-1]
MNCYVVFRFICARGVTEDGRTETGPVGVMPSKLRLQNGPGYCLSGWRRLKLASDDDVNIVNGMPL